MNDAVRFVLDGDVVTVRGADPTRTVLQYLREDLRRTGTKEGCAEGDCGACTVVLVDLGPDGALRCRAVNSCIQFLPTIDGKQLVTVESLSAAEGPLHPVQQALVECHGSQCGFCTPGFVMSLFALYKTNANPGRREIDDALAGNLCRCTGYRPIVEAARRMYEIRAASDDERTWLNRPAGGCVGEGGEDRGLIELLRPLRRGDTLAVEFEGRRFFSPLSADELCRLAGEYPDAVILAGGTDVGLWVTKQLRQLDAVIYIGNIGELNRIGVRNGCVEIGAGVTLTDAMPVILSHFPDLEELLTRFASPPIRNACTLGGNIVNGSPIGDSMPALIALSATVVLRDTDSRRELALDEFYLGYQKNERRPGEILQCVRIPLPGSGSQLRSYKLSKRFDQDISTVCGAYYMLLDGDTVVEIRIAYGGMAAIPRRATACERALRGNKWNDANVRTAMTALGEDYQPITDMRAGNDYRSSIARNLLYRFFLETTGSERHYTRVYDYARTGA